jgi:hypothetical protein
MTCPNYSTCKHAGRCDGVPGDDCYEPRLDTDRCPPPVHVTADRTLTALRAPTFSMRAALALLTFGQADEFALTGSGETTIGTPIVEETRA